MPIDAKEILKNIAENAGPLNPSDDDLSFEERVQASRVKLETWKSYRQGFADGFAAAVKIAKTIADDGGEKE